MLAPMIRSTRRAIAPACLALAGLALAALPGCDEDALRPPPPAASSSAHAPASAAASASAAVPEPTGNANFAVVARSPDAFELYPLRGALFVDAAGFLATLGDGPLQQSPGLMKGLEMGVIGRVAGAWPDAAWLVAGEATYRWTDDRWAKETLLAPGEALLAVAPWEDGRLLAAIGVAGNELRLVQAGGKPGAVLPVPSPPGPQNAERGEAEGERETPCKTRMKARAVSLAGLASGEVYAVGHECEPLGHGAPIVERWDPKQARGTVEALPAPERGGQPAPRGIVARSPGEVLVYGSVGVPASPYLARFDGKGWSLDAAPFGAAVDTLGAAADGTLWASAGGAFWKKGGAAWEPVALPPGLVAQAAWPQGNDVWVAARQIGGRARAVLLRTAREPRPELIRLPPRNAMVGSLAAHKRFFATAACDRVYVDLASLGPSKDAAGKAAAVPKRFPALEPVLSGDFAALAPVVEDIGGELRVGVPVPTRDLGRKLAAAYQEKNPGSAPAVVCHEPMLAGEAGKPAGGKPKAPVTMGPQAAPNPGAQRAPKQK
jgi:hypothetical protein